MQGVVGCWWWCVVFRQLIWHSRPKLLDKVSGFKAFGFVRLVFVLFHFVILLNSLLHTCPLFLVLSVFILPSSSFVLSTILVCATVPVIGRLVRLCVLSLSGSLVFSSVHLQSLCFQFCSVSSQILVFVLRLPDFCVTDCIIIRYLFSSITSNDAKWFCFRANLTFNYNDIYFIRSNRIFFVKKHIYIDVVHIQRFKSSFPPLDR